MHSSQSPFCPFNRDPEHKPFDTLPASGHEPTPEPEPAPEPEPTPEPTEEPKPEAAPAPEKAAEPTAPAPSKPAAPAEDAAEPESAPVEELEFDESEDGDEPALPYLAWRVVDANGTIVPETSLHVQREGSDAVVALIDDNTGEADYRGADLNPEPGEFLVKELEDEESDATLAIAAATTYELTPAKAEGFAVGEDAEVEDLTAATSETDDLPDVVLTSLDDAVTVSDEPATDDESDEASITGPTVDDSEEIIDSPAGTDELTLDATDTPDASLALDEDAESLESLESDMMPMALGPDGGTAPYVYWEVRDTEGNLVPGATFSFDARINTGFIRPNWNWNNGTNANAIADCDGTCSSSNTGNVLDRDGDGGEFLLEHRATSRSTSGNRITAGSNYRVSQVTAPPGYEWVVSGSNTQTIGDTNGNNATWNNGSGAQTHDFGTFQVRKLQTQPICTPGYVYGISASGQIRQVDPSGTVTNLGTPASGVSSFNGIGIGSGGETVYAYERFPTSGQQTQVTQATIWQYNTTTGQWVSQNHTINSNTNDRTVQFVAGAVNFSTGNFWIGGFSTNGNVFRLWEYNPTTNTSTYKGALSTPGGSSSGNNNGDIAFDSAGNLFVVRGTGDTTTVFSVTAANVAAANGGTIPASQSASVTTMDDVNGVAFDSTGKAFLGSSGELSSYNMPNWSGSTAVVSSGLNSTDLATCSSPPTIVIEKEVIGGRVDDGDQFELTLYQGDTLLGDATTTGAEAGVQGERIGPLPTVRNVALNFAEVAAGTTDLANYASAYQCTVTHTDGTVESLQQVNGTSGSITIPGTGEAVRCVFRNSPLVANVTINKQVTDALGLNSQLDAGWTVGASTTATTGTATQAPADTTQTTDASGNADWTVIFGAYDHRATVAVSEDATSKPGYEFLSGQCVVTGLDGSEATTTLTDPDATGLTGIKPGDQVDCTYVNKPIPGSLAITKVFDDTVPTGSGTSVEFTGAYTCELPTGTEVASGTWAREGTGAAELTPDDGTPAVDQIPAGAICSATEDQPSVNEGLPNSSWEWGEPSIGSDVTIAADEISTVTVTNTAERVYGNFSVTKDVPEGSVVDSGMQFSGNWTCTLGDDEVDGEWGPIAADGTWTSTFDDEIPLGATCVVTEEYRDEFPVEDGSHEWDGDPVITPEDGVEASDQDNLNVITVTNATMPVLGSVSWTKVDDSGTVLSGSVWSLEGPGEGGTTVPIEDCVADSADECEGLDQDHVAGQFLIENLEWGDYTLTETQAPAGYYLITDPISFTIGAGDNLVKALGDIENTPITGPDLPLTGGIGRDAFFLAGLSILTLGLGTAMAHQISNRRKEVA